MKVTIESYGKTYTMEWAADDVRLPELLQSICNMLVALGWSERTIIELFQSEPGDENNPFKWEVHQ